MLELTEQQIVWPWGFGGGPQILYRMRPLDFEDGFYVSIFNSRGHRRAGVLLKIRKRRKPEQSGLTFTASTKGEGMDLILANMEKGWKQ